MLVRHAPCWPPHALLVLAGSQQKTGGAVEYLGEHPVPGAMYKTSSFGSYLGELLGPAHKVYVCNDALWHDLRRWPCHCGIDQGRLI